MSDKRTIKIKGEREIRWLVTLLVAVLIGLIANMVLYYQDSHRDKQRLADLSDMRVTAKQLVDVGVASIAGESQSFEQLLQLMQQNQQRLQRVSNLSGRDSQQTVNIAGIVQTQRQMNASLESILSKQDALMLMRMDAELIIQALPALHQQWSDIAELLLARNAKDRQIMLVNQQAWLIQRMIRQLDHVLLHKDDGREMLDRFGREAAKLRQITEDLSRGNSQASIDRITDTTAIGLLNQIDEQQAMLARSMTQLANAVTVYAEAQVIRNNLAADYARVDTALQSVQNSIEQLPEQRWIGLRTMFVLGSISLLLLAWVLIRQRRLTTQQLQEAADTTERNQKAILRLLDELADLADGDLTISATVTEDFTGAIADSINFTIDQLRVLVSNINDTAVKVSSAAQDSQATALQLAKASEHQAQEIAGASAAINEMAVTIDQVSVNAEESARVADRSVELADTGAKVVRNTIDGMDTIREQIQDTAKRIKRLGESSQEIGDIISLINDIADQTNILALNAAIQASMAGDAGRGFAVVADEVQRLAERSSAATRQIEVLVKTIQSDTSEAVISMEKTTADVVKGAELANDAGDALSEIEEVSNDLAELIQNISNAARQQASSAVHVSNTMNVIQDITSQTAQGTMATAKSIGNLSDLANELRGSVAGFTLPHKNDESAK